jgi:hypothetical protein
MKPAIAVGLAALATTVMTASPTYAASIARTASTQSCAASSTKIDGEPAVNYCGPATATLAIGGKTYTFKNGICQSIHVSGIKLDITLGTIVQNKLSNNAGKPYFALDLSPGADSSLLNMAYSGGKKLAGGIVSYSGSFTTKGTFKSTSDTPFSGSWNCHGVFEKH